MFKLAVRGRMMIAHSFRGEIFGPAQQLHGATYVVDVAFSRAGLDPDGLVVDIGLAHHAVDAVLAAFNYKNLDELPEFAGVNTTTEFLAQEIWRRLCAKVADGSLGVHAGGLSAIGVTLRESDVAWASFEAPLPEA